jgi:hypothetical protein
VCSLIQELIMKIKVVKKGTAVAKGGCPWVVEMPLEGPSSR